jgi:hypothetical protein
MWFDRLAMSGGYAFAAVTNLARDGESALLIDRKVR